MADNAQEPLKGLLDAPHSQRTLDALVEKYGWARLPDNLNVAKSFPGMEHGDDAVPNGRRTIYAGYRFDSKRARYISAILGDKQLLDIDGQGRDAADVARELNKRVEALVAHRHAVTGYRSPEPATTIALSTLIGAVQAGDEERVESLLREKGALDLLDARDADGFTPLHHAAIRNDRIAELLLAAGAEAGAKTPSGLDLQALRTLGGLSDKELLSPKATELLKLQSGARETQPHKDNDKDLWPTAARANGQSDIPLDELVAMPAAGQAAEEDALTIKKIAGRNLDDEDMGTIKGAQVAAGVGASAPRTLLAGLYVGNDAGEYTRVGGTKVALIDAGTQITLKNRELETFMAGIELAKSKGWTTIEVGGARRYRQAAWLEGRAEGLDVQGYEPTPKDLELLDKRLEAKALRQSIAEGRPDVMSKSLEEAKAKALAFKKDLVAPNLKSGTYAGRVFAESSHHILLNVDGRANTATVIEKAKLDGAKYRLGEVLKLQFKDGALVPGLFSGQSVKMTR